MLVLSRRVGEKIRIGSSIVVTLLRVDSHRARIGVEAPRDVPIFRQEVFDFLKDGSVATQTVKARWSVNGSTPLKGALG